MTYIQPAKKIGRGVTNSVLGGVLLGEKSNQWKVVGT